MSLHNSLLRAARRIVAGHKKHRIEPSDAIGGAIAALSETSAPRHEDEFADLLQRLDEAEKKTSN
ncbi:MULTISPECIES: hypothetical protein [Brucella/Ochrobactrum group]|uniref:hypothetical protein n=1 Tax=Brucella/Ochrobactrum group TaxID=2826938 RepID=UPI001C044878|nr:hypothetical protein [Brucella sp. NBRC 12950]QWK80374.1 hypothetical protein KMS41_21705 [Ochrobactrum sp. BTU1]GLU29534.1 hypothetical protein Brsp01_47670 [Brucella sp. NBRC 12950]